MKNTLLFFTTDGQIVYACQLKNTQSFDDNSIKKIQWLFDDAQIIKAEEIKGSYISVRREMISPWSTNAVEICKSMGVGSILRIEVFYPYNKGVTLFDPMLQEVYDRLDDDIFTIDKEPESVEYIQDIAAYNNAEGLALRHEEVEYLKNLAVELKRDLTDSEVFGFSQVNSEHCRHKIFNGEFVIDGQVMESSLFDMIKKTSKLNPKHIVSAYKDNVAFFEGSKIEQFAPNGKLGDGNYKKETIDAVYSLKAETHNFPTTVEPFSGAATGSGGEIRDRLAGGTGSIPLSGSAVYMTPYPRLEGGIEWDSMVKARPWKYQTPIDLLIKASNGASDFGNKFGQPLINGSILTFEFENSSTKQVIGYDKVIMLAGGIGFTRKEFAQKKKPKKGDKIVLLGGDNYRIGMGGGAVSSVATGLYDDNLERNAVQRSNPEMQKRVANVIRVLVEKANNPIISIHDHGAGGHLNCLSELVEETGGTIDLDALPIGDTTLSLKEIISNESQERIGLIVDQADISLLKTIAKRERAPIYIVGTVREDMHLEFNSEKENSSPVDMPLKYLIGNTPKLTLEDESNSVNKSNSNPFNIDKTKFEAYLARMLQLEAVGSKDWLTNKVDRCVTGKVALQQTAGELQLTINNAGVVMLDYTSTKGLATSIGHTPIAALIDAEAGSRLSLAESLTNIVWCPLTHGLEGVILSANWMWAANNEGENARLYKAVKALSDVCCDLDLKIPTGKDSLSMKQVYNKDTVLAPGTVIISAAAEVTDVKKIITPVINNTKGKTSIYYIDFSSGNYKLGGSSLLQSLGDIGDKTPDVGSIEQMKQAFGVIQDFVIKEKIYAGHDIGSGGLITSLLEMTFANTNGGMSIDLSTIEKDAFDVLFAECPAGIIQSGDDKYIEDQLKDTHVKWYKIGYTTPERKLNIVGKDLNYSLDINYYREKWSKTSYLLDKEQIQNKELSLQRYNNFVKQPLQYIFPEGFNGSNKKREIKKTINAAVIREKGSNSEREMAYLLQLSGFEVKDIHMTDLVNGTEDLSDVELIVFVGGFSNSDVLGSAKGWAGAFKYNTLARQALENFYNRKDTLSLGICNGCQLMMMLGLIMPDLSEKEHPKMQHNSTGKFECNFVNVNIGDNNAIMLQSLRGCRLGIWAANGEGRFDLQGEESNYHIPMKYSYDVLPGNLNGSDYAAAALCSKDGRHLAMMPHLERSIYKANWAHYPSNRQDVISPWRLVLDDAFNWLSKDK